MTVTTNQVIEVVIARDGRVRAETKGFSGANCQQASRFLETALGRRLDEVLTTEFYCSNIQCQRESEAN